MLNICMETNSMANVVPQDSELNRKGLWRHLEKVTECFRDDHSVHVIGGNFGEQILLMIILWNLMV